MSPAKWMNRKTPATQLRSSHESSKETQSSTEVVLPQVSEMFPELEASSGHEV
jgi:hypothetical protein